MFVLYKHTSKSTGKSYIGFTSKSMEQRWHEHAGEARRGGNAVFHRAIRKYGVDGWHHELLAIAETIDEAKRAEIILIKCQKTTTDDGGYNMTRGGDSFRLGPRSKSHCRNISLAKKGEKHHFFGKELAEEHCFKLGQSCKKEKPIKPIKRENNLGSRNGRAKLTEDDVSRILQKIHDGAPRKVIIAEFGISVSHYKRIRSGQSWMHIHSIHASDAK